MFTPDKSATIKPNNRLRIRRFVAAQPHRAWRIAALLTALLTCLPVATIAYLALSAQENIWPHLLATTLPKYIANTALLLLGVGASTLLTGVLTAHLVTTYQFPLRKSLEWLLLLPLAMPAYVIAHLTTDLLEFAGPVQRMLRAWFGWQLASDYWFFDVRSLGGAVMLMGLVLYPYVYLLARALVCRTIRAFGRCQSIARARPRRHFLLCHPADCATGDCGWGCIGVDGSVERFWHGGFFCGANLNRRLVRCMAEYG